MIEVPRSRSERMVSSSVVASFSEIDAVGSSRRRMRASADSARAISMSCCCAALSVATPWAGETPSPTMLHEGQRVGDGCAAGRPVRRRSPRTRSRSTFSPTVKVGTRLRSWWTTLMPRLHRLARVADVGRLGRRGDRCPMSGRSTPLMILISVDLPAPFSPRRAMDRAAPQRQRDVARAPARPDRSW